MICRRFAGGGLSKTAERKRRFGSLPGTQPPPIPPGGRFIVNSSIRAVQSSCTTHSPRTRAWSHTHRSPMELQPDFDAGVSYWANTEATVNGVLGGYGPYVHFWLSSGPKISV